MHTINLIDTPFPAKLTYLIFTSLKLYLATAINKFKWVEITHIVTKHL